MTDSQQPAALHETQGAFVRERLDERPAPEPGGNTLLKVAAQSRPAAIAGAIAGVMRGGSTATIQAVGAGAVNQSVKAIAIARTYLQQDGITICCVPSFLNLAINDQERTAICLLIEPDPRTR